MGLTVMVVMNWMMELEKGLRQMRSSKSITKTNTTIPVWIVPSVTKPGAHH